MDVDQLKYRVPRLCSQVVNKTFRLELYHFPVGCGGAFLGGFLFFFFVLSLYKKNIFLSTFLSWTKLED